MASSLSSTISSRSSTTSSLSSTYYLRNFYAMNRNAMKSSSRKEYTASELTYEDSRALQRAAKTLKKYDFEDEDNLEHIKTSLKAMIDTYNNAIDSSEKTDSRDIGRYTKQLKKLVKSYKSDLEDIGVKIDEKGKLSYSESLLSSAKLDSIKKVLGKDSKFTTSLKQVSRRMNSATYNELYQQLTGNGKQINISL